MVLSVFVKTEACLNPKHSNSEQLRKSQECEEFSMIKCIAEYYSSSEALFSAFFWLLLLEIIFSSLISVFLYLSEIIFLHSQPTLFLPTFIPTPHKVKPLR